MVFELGHKSTSLARTSNAVKGWLLAPDPISAENEN